MVHAIDAKFRNHNVLHDATSLLEKTTDRPSTCQSQSGTLNQETILQILIAFGHRIDMHYWRHESRQGLLTATRPTKAIPVRQMQASGDIWTAAKWTDSVIPHAASGRISLHLATAGNPS
jgi:hypothetical protein